ncbi:OmpA family protein [Myxococcota bacterium]|nr:OmpA family protein [Myxococcota bacterium]MBU1429711.1 OmpA family protein [Myxococcota bacterium]MBU1899801.1 OmpA family protein [Myxococcota bacterium]
MCAAGKCTRKPGYCDPNVACPGDQKCRDNECGDECLDNTDCSNKPGTYCSNGGCIDKPECGENADTPACPEGKECKDGRCEQKVARCNGAAVLFPFNQAKILNAERNKLDAIADCMKDPYASQLSVEGHCDERGSEEYNLTLGEQRANAVKQYLSRKGVSANKLSARSWGEERPASSGSNESAWRKNRRTEFVPN